MSGFVILALYVLLMVFVYVYGELQSYKRGGDVWDWTVKLAKFLEARK